MPISWPWKSANDAPKPGNSVELFAHDGTFLGYRRILGNQTPAFLFAGDELYVHSGERGAMRTLAPGERPLLAVIAAGMSLRGGN